MVKNFFLKIILLLLLLSHFSFVAYAESTDFSWPYYTDETNSKACYVMDADSGVVLFEKNSREKLYPASLAKLMTAIIVFDKVKGDYDDLVTFSYISVTRDIDKKSATIGASAGDQLSIKDCLYSLLLPSANDAANALAEYIAGNIDDFALLMNEKAKNIGLTNTHFVNPSGLHDDNQYTTAEDMAKILQYAMKYPMFMQISSSISYTHAPIRKYKNPENSNNQILNTNSIMVPGSGYYYNGITSGKTGHTELAGYNLAASARKNKMNLICITLGGKSEKQRFEETKKLFDFYFDNYKSIPINEFDNKFNSKINAFSINDVELLKTLDITCTENAHITLPKNVDERNIFSKISFTPEEKYNKYAIGTISYYLKDKLIGKGSIIGKDEANAELIFTTHLDLTKNTKENVSYDNKKKTIIENENVLFFRDSNDNLVISKTLWKVIILIIILITTLALIVYLYINVFSNINFNTNKILFTLRRKFKSKKH